MMSRLLTLSLAFLMLVSKGCKNEVDTILDAGGVAVKLPHQWQVSRSDDGELANSVVAIPVVYNSDHVLIGGRLKSQRSIISVNTSKGNKIWEWQDLLSLKQDASYKDPISIWANYCYHSYDDKLFFAYATSSYCVDMLVGRTNWKNKNNLARFDIATGIGITYFTPGGTYGLGDDERLYIGYLTDASGEKYLLTPAYKKVDKPLFNGFGMIQGLVPFVSQGDTLISLLCYDQIADRQQQKLGTFSALYNLSKRSWIYDRVVMNENSTEGVQNATLSGQYLYYNSLRELNCFEVMTGKMIWSLPFTQAFSSLLVADGKLYGNNEDRYTYCFDLATGRQIWKEQSSGTSTQLTYLNGVLYFLGGGDGKLHALDANTGQHHWRLESPDLKKNSGAWFYGVCVAVPGKDGNKGRIVATTGLSAYGYEAIR
jgi:outer membrane protein assembly factor BamB